MKNNSKRDYSLKKLITAFQRLKESAKIAVDDLDRDGVLKRFEFAFELFWKAVKIFMEYEGFECAGPRSCIKEGVKRGFLDDGELLLDMLEDRNKTSHIYDESTAKEIFERIKVQYISLIESNIKYFENYLSKDEGEA